MSQLQNFTWGCPPTESCSTPIGAIRGKHYSQAGEDVSLVRNVFCDVCHTRQRNYLEIGALNGVKYSNTLLLEHSYNWGGLLIEGLPANAKELIAHRGKSGKNVIFNEAVCSTVGTVNFTDTPNAGTAGVMETMTPQYLKSWGRRFKRMVEVPCRPLSDMMRLASISELDFFSLDVEGAELLVLQTFDWRVPVKVFCIEMDRGDAVDSQIRSLLHTHGYVETRAFALGGGLNKIFVHGSLNSTLDARLQHCQQPADRCNRPTCAHGDRSLR